MNINETKECLETMTRKTVEVEERSGRFIAHWQDWDDDIQSKLRLADAMQEESDSVEEVRVTPKTFTIVLVLPKPVEEKEEPIIFLPNSKLS